MNYGKTRELFFIVPGKPRSKRTGEIGKTWGGKPVLMKNNQTLVDEFIIKKTFKKKYPNFKCVDKLVRVDINAYFPPTGKLKAKKRKDLVESEAYMQGRKPDEDNIRKLVNDALKGVVFSDDGRGRGNIEKFYSFDPRLEIKITIYDDVELI